ncbi:MAG TPA: Hsp20/alpha crystallin family protein [Phycisphaerae bacterium]|nr:Hsp20/alpha crystallin family protein [Phycisphaerae bacterium]
MNITPWRNKRDQRIDSEGGTTALTRFRDEMDHLFERFFGDTWPLGAMEGLTGRSGMGPRIDLAETENDITLKADLPGVDPKEVDVQVVGNMLTIRGEKKLEKEDKKRDYHFVERQYGSFQRSLQLPTTVDPNKVDALFKDGVLTVTIAKRPEARPKRIAVKNTP